MIFGKLNKVFEDQYKTLPLKKVRLKTDPKFDKLPYEGYILAEAPAPVAAANPPGKSLASKAGSFMKGVAGAYEGLKSGAQKFKELGQGNISVLAEIMGAYGEKLLQSALDKSTLKLSLFGKKGYSTGYILRDDPYHAVICKYVGVDNLNLTFNIGDSAVYNKDTVYPIIFTDDGVRTAFKNRDLSNGNFKRLNFVKNSKVVDSYPNTGTFFIYNINGEAIPELTSENVSFQYDPEFKGYKMGNSIAAKAEPGNKHLILWTDTYTAKPSTDGKYIYFIVSDFSKITNEKYKSGFKTPPDKVLRAETLYNDETGREYESPLIAVDQSTITLVDKAGTGL